ncbi:putative aarF domain-containing protein kinase 5 [Taenia solium]|eukprot:TsM_000021400 transcript=TsM_000021400 gene=TsM_000021400
MNHLLPSQITSTLEALHDKALSRAPDEIKRIFQKDFGVPPEELFRDFEIQPFAAASLAQVHRAVTKDGKEVAVKVQYEDLRERFNGDISTLELLLHFVKLIHPRFDLAWILSDLKETLAQELDFQHEAANAERCRKDLAVMGSLQPAGLVHIPIVEYDLSSKRVLTTEFIDGIKISDTLRLQTSGFSLATIDKIMVAAFGRQVFCTGFVHADPHPGNLLIRERRSSSTSLLFRVFHFILGCFFETPAQLVIIDHGLYQSISDSERLALCEMYKAILSNDERCMMESSRRLKVTDYATFGDIIIQRPWRRMGRVLSSKLTEADKAYIREQAELYFDRILSVLREMPRPLLLFIRNLNMVRSICRSHGDRINRHEYLIYMALLGSQALNTRCINSAWLRWKGYILMIKWEAFRNWVCLLTLRLLAFFGLAPDFKEIQSVAIQTTHQKQMQYLESGSA